ncbi:MAG: hypothetical protein J6Q54_08585 [Oscillospiraceae bacterium]|nr:hypothetical protein [Oscillospiraceae bacterium]
MYFPELMQPAEGKSCINSFGGLDLRGNIPAGSFARMENLCSDGYPLTKVRPPRRVMDVTDAVGGVTIRDNICHVDGTWFVLGSLRVDMGLTPGEKTLVPMGVYVIILPDKKYINTLDVTDWGEIEACSQAEGAELSLCKNDGTAFSSLQVSDAAPTTPADGDHWLDTKENVLKIYIAAEDIWQADTGCAVKITATGIGKGFSANDGVEISGFTDPRGEGFNGSAILLAAEEDAVFISGLVTGTYQETGIITLKRQMPKLDFVIEAGNRLWGCRYGKAADGQVVNEIYASKLGDFKNWSCFRGLSTDSYRVSLGADGAFTGAVNYMGSPLFFRESWLHKIHGTYPAEYRVQTTGCQGVAKGSHKSLAVVDGVLYYLSHNGLCGYDGAIPAPVSQVWGQRRFTNGVAAACGSKYYISLLDEEGNSHLLVYDTGRGLFHREDDFRAVELCTWENRLVGYDGKTIYIMNAEPDEQTPVSWMAQTGVLTAQEHTARYIRRLSAKLTMTPGSSVQFYVRYDQQGDWEFLGSVLSHKNGIVHLPLRTRRCESLELRLEGQREVQLHSLVLTAQEGSEI